MTIPLRVNIFIKKLYLRSIVYSIESQSVNRFFTKNTVHCCLVYFVPIKMKFSIVVLFALVVVITATDYEEDTFALCNDHCKDDSYNPVCAVDDAGHRKTFNNDCHLAQVNCKSATKWRKKLDKKCG